MGLAWAFITILALAFCAMDLIVEAQENKFNKANVIVELNPYVKPADASASLGVNELIPLIEKIASRLSKIQTFPIFYSKKRLYTVESIPIAIAKYNYQVQSTELNGIIEFRHFNEDGLDAGNKHLFDLVIGIAERSNEIWNGSVKIVKVNVRLDNTLAFKKCPEIIKYYSEMRKENATQVWYKFGASLPLQYCISHDYRSGLSVLVKYLDLVSFSLFPTSFDYKIGVEKSSARFIQDFERCLKRVKSIREIDVAFETAWPDTDYDGQQNYSSLVYFWEKMNIWSGKNFNNKVILINAFDTPYMKSRLGTMGWWKHSQDDNLNLTFEEKRKGLERKVIDENIPAPQNISNFTKEDKSQSLTAPIISVVGLITFFALLLLGLVITFTYKKLMKEIQKPTHLTGLEMQEFLIGDKTTTSNSLSSFMASAYDRKYELGKEKFVLNEKAILGSGNFGTVCKAKIKLGGCFEDAAAKRVQPNCKSIGLKGLLSEIKILSHLGKHENIVCLVGANTEELKSGNIIVFTELCENGSLEKYLREIEPQTGLHDGLNCSELLCKHSLHYKWVCEIGRGMEFITSNGVVHADLATRNVLLNSNLTAKISDFGLSRRLYKYGNYRKNDEEALPWRWMSPESLRKLLFNEKTDVWAFGVTLWEIFSLGAVPYGGLLWNANFHSRLVGGMRLEKPEHSLNDMYEVMTKCWKVEANDRPTFKNLCEILNQR